MWFAKMATCTSSSAWAACILAASCIPQAAAYAQPPAAAGDPLALWQCASQPPRQQFSYTTAVGQDQYRLALNGTGNGNGQRLVWDISGPSNATGTVLHVWGEYGGSYPSQEWTLQPVTGGNGAVQLVSIYNGMCVGAQGDYIGAVLGIYPCSSSDPLQQWSYTVGPNGQDLGPLALASDASLCAQAGNNTPSCDIPPFNGYPYCTPGLPVSARVADLVSRMTTAEKVAAMDSSVPAIPRLAVPRMNSGEALHGAATGCLSNPTNGSTGCPTSFPCPMALAASFDQDLWGQVGLAIGMEARALYNADAGSVWLFAPNINPGRDPRWGRNQEVPGEDPLAVSSYARSFISGLQGQGGPDPTHLLAAATAKHFIAYDLEGYMPRTDVMPRPPTAVCDTPGGCQRWNFDAFPLARDLSGYFLPPFLAAVTAPTPVRSIMCSYNAINGQPACASDLMATLIRGGSGPGWDGHVVSDCTAIELMQDTKWDGCKPPYPPLNCTPDAFPGHNYTSTVAETALAALTAGTDVNCGPFNSMWLDYLATNGSLGNANVTNGYLDTAVSRVYTSAVKLGLLDPQQGQVYPSLPPSTVDSPQHRQLALQAAREGIVLVKNDGNLLPLAAALAPQPAESSQLAGSHPTRTGASLRLAFIGPHANSTQAFLSSYHGTNTLVDSHSPLQVALSRGLSVTYAPGCNICDIVPPGFPNMPCPAGSANNTSGFPAAVAAASAADIAVVFVGLDQTSEAENFDRDNVTLPGVQEQMVQAVFTAQPKTVVITVSGGSVSSPWIMSNIPAVLHSFYPGELGGDALLDVLTGVYGPSGKMPVTTYPPVFTAGRDMRDMDLASGQGVTHNYFTGTPLIPYGWGLSYANVSYEWTEGTVEGWLSSGKQGTAAGGSAEGLQFSRSDDGLPTVTVPISALSGLAAQHGLLASMPLTLTVTNHGLAADKARQGSFEATTDCVVLAFATSEDRLAAVEASGGVHGRVPSGPLRSLFNFTRLRGLQPGETRAVSIPWPEVKPGSAIAAHEPGRTSLSSSVTAAPGGGGHAVHEPSTDAGTWVPQPGSYIITVGDVASPARMRLVIRQD